MMHRLVDKEICFFFFLPELAKSRRSSAGLEILRMGYGIEHVAYSDLVAVEVEFDVLQSVLFGDFRRGDWVCAAFFDVDDALQDLDGVFAAEYAFLHLDEGHAG